MTVPSAVERITGFPPAATSLLHRIPLRTDETYDVRDLISQDPALLQDVAEKINARFAVGDSADEPAEVISRINTDQLAEIALTILVRGYIKGALQVDSVHGYWRYTLACALTCRELSHVTPVNNALAYSGGLLHDIGRLALIAAYPEKYGNLLVLVQRTLSAGEPIDIAEYERTLFGLDRFAIAGWLAEKWDLPASLRTIVGKFKEGGRNEIRHLVKTVQAGSSIAHSLGYGLLSAAAPQRPVESILKLFSFPPTDRSSSRMQPVKMSLELPDLIEEQLLRYSVL